MKTTSYLWYGATDNPGGRQGILKAISIPAGKRIVKRIRLVDGEGFVQRIYVKQASGTAAGFDVRVVTSTIPYGDEVTAGTEAAYNAALAVNPDLFNAVEKQTATAGNAVEFRPNGGDFGRAFVSVDGTGPTARGQATYLVIIPTATPDVSTWEVEVRVVKPGD